MMAQKYHIACYKDGRSVDQVLWWRYDGAGYTFDLDEAGVYEAKDPRVTARQENPDSDNVPVPIELAQAFSVRRVSTDNAGPFRSPETLIQKIKLDAENAEKLKNFKI